MQEITHTEGPGDRLNQYPVESGLEYLVTVRIISAAGFVQKSLVDMKFFVLTAEKGTVIFFFFFNLSHGA